jgi:hypothetical protein
MADFGALVRKVVGVADALTSSLQVTVSHYRRTGQAGDGTATFASPVTRRGLFEASSKRYTDGGGVLHVEHGKLTFVGNVPIVIGDEITVQGTRVPVQGVEGLGDPADTGKFVTEVTLGWTR